jgi:hypothetical protein
MNEGVTSQETAEPETKSSSDKELNFRRLEEARNKEREDKIRLELQNQQLTKEVQEMKEFLKPKEVDPFDDVDEYIEPELKARLQAKFDKVSSSLERKAEEIAERKYQEIQKRKEEDDKKNFLPKLQKEFNDFDQIMTEQNIMELGKNDSWSLKTVLMIPDEYEKRKALYEKIKERKQLEENKPTIQDKVQKNMRNPYFIPSSATPNSPAIDYDLNADGARQAAYQSLKNRQKQR